MKMNFFLHVFSASAFALSTSTIVTAADYSFQNNLKNNWVG